MKPDGHKACLAVRKGDSSLLPRLLNLLHLLCDILRIRRRNLGKEARKGIVLTAVPERLRRFLKGLHIKGQVLLLGEPVPASAVYFDQRIAEHEGRNATVGAHKIRIRLFPAIRHVVLGRRIADRCLKALYFALKFPNIGLRNARLGKRGTDFLLSALLRQIDFNRFAHARTLLRAAAGHETKSHERCSRKTECLISRPHYA